MAALVATSSCLPVHAASVAAPQAASSVATPTSGLARQAAQGVAVPFEANQGQFAPQVAFGARTFAGHVFVTRDGRIVHSLAGLERAAERATSSGLASAPKPATRGPGWTLVESLPGAARLAPAGGQPSNVRVHRFHGSDPAQWQRDIATFANVELGEAWPGVAVALSAHGSNVEKLFTVRPGADPRRIRLALDGAQDLRLGPDGDLLATTGNGQVAFTAPVAFQQIDGARVDVPVRYALAAGIGRYGFEVGAYDRSHALVIDPMLQSTYIGGGADDTGKALALDGAGNVLIAGSTTSSNFPGTTGGLQSSSGGNQDGYIARFSGDLKTLLQTTYLGGSDIDDINAIAVDGSGNVFVAGTTSSTNLPGAAGGFQAAYDNGVDGFIARLSADLRTLQQSTYLGGGGTEIMGPLRFDGSGNVLVAGATTSGNFPGTAGGAQAVHAGVYDGFVARLTPNLQTLLQSTFYGGSNGDFVNAMVVNAAGKVVVTGTSQSSNLPGTAGGAQAASAGDYDAFVVRFSADLRTLEQATYFGGSGTDSGIGMALDSTGNIFITGYGNSTDYLQTAGSAQPATGGNNDAYIAKLNGGLTALLKVTYYGGNGFDIGNALVVDAADNVIVAGVEESSNMPGTAGGFQSVYGGGGDGFIARFNNGLTVLQQATYLGGNVRDEIPSMLIDGAGNFVVVGTTRSADFPTTPGGLQPAFGGGTTDAFVARLTANLLPDPLAQSISAGVAPVVPSFSVGATFVLAATSTSGLPVSYSSATPGVCSVVGNTVTMVGMGVCTIIAAQAGNGVFAAALNVPLNFSLGLVSVPTLSAWALVLLALLLGRAACKSGRLRSASVINPIARRRPR